jgi:hypothetical protein
MAWQPANVDVVLKRWKTRENPTFEQEYVAVCEIEEVFEDPMGRAYFQVPSAAPGWKSCVAKLPRTRPQLWFSYLAHPLREVLVAQFLGLDSTVMDPRIFGGEGYEWPDSGV